MKFVHKGERGLLENASGKSCNISNCIIDHSLTNRFIAGTGIFLKNSSLSSVGSAVLLSLIDSYLSESPIDIAPNAVAKYVSCEEARYNYYCFSGIHEFELFNSKVSFIEFQPFHWRDKIVVANHVYEADLYESLKFGTENKSKFIDEALQKMVEHINAIFGFDSIFSHVNVNIVLNQESFDNINI